MTTPRAWMLFATVQLRHLTLRNVNLGKRVPILKCYHKVQSKLFDKSYGGHVKMILPSSPRS